MGTCELIGKCSGCSWLTLPIEEQLTQKRAHIFSLLESHGISRPSAFKIVSPESERLRDRVDITWERTANGLALGLYETNSKEILDISNCPALSVELEEWLQEFRAVSPPSFIEKGSVRLRVSPSGKRGVWLDLSHEDTKALFEEKSWLHWLLGQSVVEIGQRFKPLVLSGEELKLQKEPTPQAWFETYFEKELTPLPLFGTIGSFTQPGFKANRALIDQVISVLPQQENMQIIELFSGLGNFTLPLASLGHKVTAYEVNEVALQSFKVTTASLPSLTRNINFLQSNLYQDKALPSLQGFDLLFVDPPRSGLKGLLPHMASHAENERPKNLIYVSCFAESMASDLRALSELGYKLTALSGVDQFPNTPHCEWIARLER